MNDLTTACKSCVFANYIGKTQIDCKLGRIKKYREKGVDIIGAEDLEENEFFVLEAWCNAYREQDWADQHEDIFAQVEKEYITLLGFVVILGTGTSAKGNEKSLLSDLHKTLEGIKEVNGSPSYVVIVNNSPVPHFDVINQAQECLEDSDIEYKVSNVLESNVTDLECVDLVFSGLKNGYYSILKAGKLPVSNDMIDLINNKVNKDLDSIAYIKGYDGVNGVTVQAVMHKFLNGNYGKTLLQKIEAIQKDSDFGDKGMDVIRTWEDIKNG